MKKPNLSKKRIIAIASTAGILCIGGVIGGLALTGNADAESEKAETVTIVDTETGEEVVVDADSDEAKAAMADPTMEVKENRTSDKSSNDNSGSKNSGNSNNRGNSRSHNNGNNNSSNSGNSNSGNKDNGSKPSGNTGNSTPSQPSKPSEPAKPAHTHSWNPVYTSQPVYEQVPYYGTMCKTCGYTCQGGIMSHMEASPNCSGYDTGVVIGYNTVQTGTQQVLSHYACSCGATKQK